MSNREAFEKWALEVSGWSVYANYTDATKTTFVSYARDDVQDCWEAWQACEAEQSKRIAKLEREVTLLNKVAENAARDIGELEKQNAELVEYIKHLGMVSDTCTFNILKEVCGGCRCERKKALASCLTKQKNV